MPHDQHATPPLSSRHADDAAPIEIAFDPPDPATVFSHYLETCRQSGVKPVSRERALGLIQEWGEVLLGRPEPTTH